MLLERVQLIKEGDQTKFAVIPSADYRTLKELLSDEEKLTDYLDYLHMQRVKAQDEQRLSLDEVRRELALD